MHLIDAHELAARTAGITYREVAARLIGPPPPPAFMTGPVPVEFDNWFYGDTEAPGAGVFIVENLRLGRDALYVWQDQALVIPQNGVHGDTINAAGALPETVLQIEGEVVILCGPGHTMYGHWLVDFLPRLHVLTACGYDIAKLRYLLPRPIQNFVLQWLNLLGITNENLLFYDIANQTCAVARAIIPTNLRGNYRALPLFADAIAAYKARLGIAGGGDRKLFVSRIGWRNRDRRLVNIEAVEAVFRAHEFEFVFPESLSIREQVALFDGAKIIAGEYGSGLHNAMFAPAGAIVLALRGTLGHPGFLQSGLCEAIGQSCGYVFGQTELLVGQQVFSVIPADVEAATENFEGNTKRRSG